MDLTASALPKESLKIIAESAGVSNISDELAQMMVADVEYRLREVAQEAIKFMKHSKRSRMTTEDVNNALRLRNIERLYGYTSKNPLNFRKVAGTDLYYIEDREHDFSEILNTSLPKCPRETTFTAHWLAVEGVQPVIKQNPPPIETPMEPTEPKTQNVTELPGAVVKNIVKHSLSKELQMYYETLTKSLTESSDKLQEAALKAIAQDPGIQQLLPYLVQFIGDQVVHNLRKLPILMGLMKAVKSLLDNEHIHIAPYLHQLMPAVCTCLVGKRLCSKPTEDHWTLRDDAANIVSIICKKFSDSYPNLKPRISKTLFHAFLDMSKPLTTHYGGIVGLKALGVHTVQTLILPNISVYMKILQPELESNGQRNYEARRCYNALLIAVGDCIRYEYSQLPSNVDSSALITSSAHYKELYAIFGESLTPYLNSPMAMDVL